ncbi:MAG: hypothetical protein ABIF88_03285 [archaeon]
MKKIFGFLYVVLFLVSLTSAHDHYYNLDSGDEILYKEKITKTLYYPDDDFVYSKTVYAYYDDDERFSSYKYRHGYSYRDSAEFWEEHRDYYSDYYRREKIRNYYGGDYKKRDYDYSHQKSYYYEYVPYLRETRMRECYPYPPKGKLIYTPCP